MTAAHNNEQKLDTAIRRWLDVADADNEARFMEDCPDFSGRLLEQIRFAHETKETLERVCATEEERLFEQDILPGFTDRIVQSVTEISTAQEREEIDQLFLVAMDAFVRLTECSDLTRELRKQMTAVVELLTQFREGLADDEQIAASSAEQEIQSCIDDSLVAIFERFHRGCHLTAAIVRVTHEFERACNCYLSFLEQTPCGLTVPVEMSPLEYLCDRRNQERKARLEASITERSKLRFASWPITENLT